MFHLFHPRVKQALRKLIQPLFPFGGVRGLEDQP